MIKNPKENNKVEVGFNQVKQKQSDITITKSNNIFRDMRMFIDALDVKFEFKDKDNFIKDFIKLVHFDLANKSAKDLEKIEYEFFKIIKNNSSKPEMEDQFKKAGVELEKFVNGIKVWQKK